ncbi:chromobox protein homolog 3-like [Homalodisca vitripennis]|uniref:chromobox protein homolog 3-like n=1 Tax=Homalodisca vitripennis TaxID=197043 RepID=UPI001EEA4650|nr:chromobox protein homolog 3-like [Homalodisca vitripennis]KAG8269025.1 Chromobox protein 1 [Homalodisca vitripennis]
MFSSEFYYGSRRNLRNDHVTSTQYYRIVYIPADTVPPSPSSEVYHVEKVLDKRTVRGKTEYFLKWKGYSDIDNSWEPEHNLNCPDLIKDFEDERKKKKKTVVRKYNISNPVAKQKRVSVGSKTPDEVKQGFERGLEPEMIVAATYSGEEMMFLMKWKRSRRADLVTAEEAKLICPHLVIKFYEDRQIWHTSAIDECSEQ